MPENAVAEPTVKYTWNVGRRLLSDGTVPESVPNLTLGDPHSGRTLTIEPWLVEITTGYWGERLLVTITGDTIKQNGERGKNRRAHSFYSDANPEWHHGLEALPSWALPYVEHVKRRSGGIHAVAQ